jgi:adenine-specific DNA-methyltransferase
MAKKKSAKSAALKSIANNSDIKAGMSRIQIDAAILRHAEPKKLHDKPTIDRSKVRVTGPFTVEAVPTVTVEPIEEPSPQPSPRVLGEGAMPADTSIARSGATARQEDWRSELLQTGVRGKGGAQIEFARLEPLPALRYLHAVGETKGEDREDRGDKPLGSQRVVVSFGPEHAPIEQRHVDQALDEAEKLRPKPDLVLFAAFHFDPEAAKDIDETVWPGVEVHKVQMNADLLTDDLKKKKSSNESFWLIGQPDVEVEKIAKGDDTGKHRVTVHGIDYYNPATGTVDSGGTEKIALWLLDTDYDGRSLYPQQVFFVLSPGSDQLKRLAKTLKAEVDEELIESYYGTQSLSFEPGEFKRVAVKIVDDRGIESLKIVNLE